MRDTSRIRASTLIAQLNERKELNDTYELYGFASTFGYLPIGREQAKQLGKEFYYGEVCPRAHRARYTDSTYCVVCKRNGQDHLEPVNVQRALAGKPRSEESRAKQSAKMKAVWAERHKNADKSKVTRSDEAKRLMSQRRHEYWEKKRQEQS